MKTKIFYVLLSFCFLCVPIFLSTSIAQNSVVKIPPPIEGLPPQEKSLNQKLEKTDITILTAQNEMHEFRVEVARTNIEQAKGLMHRDTLDKNTGMLFLYNDELSRNFWMKNTLIPLDIIFIRKDGVIHHIHPMAEPGSLDLIHSNGNVTAVLEITGGEAAALGINVGDRVMHDVFSLNAQEILTIPEKDEQ